MRERRPARSLDIVICLHCSGSSSSQWQQLVSRSGHRFRLEAPGLVEYDSRPAWSGTSPYSLT